jgi:hypothetical protein
VVEGVQRGVSASALRLGSDEGGQDSARERAEPRDDHEQPWSKRRGIRRAHHQLAVCAEGLVAGEILEQVALHDLERDEEERPHAASNRPDEGGVQQHPSEETKIELRHRGGSQT